MTDSGRHALAEAIANGLLQDQRFRAVVAAIRKAHPYEEPAIYLIPLFGEDEL